ncbi:MAG: phytanoyl-CoA dioxygenase family protein [Blastocatellia bacterium]
MKAVGRKKDISMHEDLSNYHQPVSGLFTYPKTKAEWERYRLSDEQSAFFHEQGYLLGLRMLDDEQIAALRNELSELVDPKHPLNHLFYEYHSNESTDPGTALFHALGAWRITAGFHDLLWHPQFVMAASQLLGGAVRFWHDQLFCKPAQNGGVVAWHQDYSYWRRTTPMAHLTCWIGLDEARKDNGCMHYIPGSHLWPDLPITGLTGSMDSIQTILNDEQRAAFKPVAIELKAGECAFHHPRMIHGSYANLTGRQRRATVINVFRDGVCSAVGHEPVLSGVPVIPKGQPLGGQFFPLLFDPATL